MTQDEIKDFLQDREDTLVFENPDYAAAAIGITSDDRVVYDYDKMIQCLMEEDGLSEEDAADFINYNTLGSLRSDAKYPIVMFPLPE